MAPALLASLLLLAALSPQGIALALPQGGLPICHPRIRLAFQLELDDYRGRLQRVRNASSNLNQQRDNPLEMILRWIDSQVLNYKSERKRQELEEIIVKDYQCRPLLR